MLYNASEFAVLRIITASEPQSEFYFNPVLSCIPEYKLPEFESGIADCLFWKRPEVKTYLHLSRNDVELGTCLEYREF